MALQKNSRVKIHSLKGELAQYNNQNGTIVWAKTGEALVKLDIGATLIFLISKIKEI
jgi:hypothetical protein